MNVGTPDGSTFSYFFKLLMNAESFDNGFSGDKPLSLPSVLNNKPSCRCRSVSHTFMIEKQLYDLYQILYQ